MAAPELGCSAIVDWVIDADTHITEPPDLFTSRLPAKYRDLAPRVHWNEERAWEEWTVGDQAPITPVGHTATAGWKDPFPAAPAQAVTATLRKSGVRAIIPHPVQAHRVIIFRRRFRSS